MTNTNNIEFVLEKDVEKKDLSTIRYFFHMKVAKNIAEFYGVKPVNGKKYPGMIKYADFVRKNENYKVIVRDKIYHDNFCVNFNKLSDKTNYFVFADDNAHGAYVVDVIDLKNAMGTFEIKKNEDLVYHLIPVTWIRENFVEGIKYKVA